MLPTSQLWILAAWIAGGLALVGIGLLVRRLGGAAAGAGGDLLQAFWVGWCALVLALQLWHFVLPVDVRATAAWGALGAVGLLLGGAAPWRAAGRGSARRPLAVLVFLAGAVWLSEQALGGARYGDTGAYFIPTIRWYTSYPIVPGLGNLHGHYAFNQSYFLYAAALVPLNIAGGPSHLANGLLVVALWAQVALGLDRVVRARRPVALADVYVVLIAPAVLPIGANMFLDSPSPDIAVVALGIVLGAELLRLFADPAARASARMNVVALLAVTGVTVKLSFAGMALAALPLGLWLWWRTVRPTLGRAVARVAIVGAIGLVAIVPWIARNIVQSGHPFFPNATFVLPVEWRVQYDMAGWMDWLRASVYVDGIATVWRRPAWYGMRLEQQGWTNWEVAVPLLVTLAGTILGALRRLIGRGGPRSLRLPFAFLLPGLASVTYCLLLCPVPRYLGATNWILAANGVLIGLGDLLAEPGWVLRAGACAAVASVTTLALRAGTEPLWRSLSGFEPTAMARVAPRTLESGLVLYLPQGTDACWDAPLPCTPFPNPALKLRREGDLGAGFMVDPVLQERYHYEPGAAQLGRSPRP